MKMDTVQLCGMEEIMEQGKWTSTNHTKGQSSSKEGDVVYIAGLEGNSLLWELPSFPGRSVGKESTCNAGDPVLLPGSGRSPGEPIGYPPQYSWASLMAQLVKNPPAMRETWVQSLVLRRSPGEGKGYSLQCSGLENSVDCIVLEVAKGQTRLNDFHFHFLYYELLLEN